MPKFTQPVQAAIVRRSRGGTNEFADTHRLSCQMAVEDPNVTFSVQQEYLGEDDLWNPRLDDPPLEGGFQVNVFGSREHYLRLAEAIRLFAELDTSGDGDFHRHSGPVVSVNGKVRLHLILRKDDVGGSSWNECFPRRSGRPLS